MLLEEEKRSVHFQVWDTAGMERFRSLAQMYYRSTDAAIVVFDVTRQDSFNDVKGWMDELDDRGPKDVVVAIAGNKVDRSDRRVSRTEAAAFAQSVGAMYFETSAATGERVAEMFADVARSVIEHRESLPKSVPPPEPLRLDIVPAQPQRCCQ
jgi:small GTP-binding protein